MVVIIGIYFTCILQTPHAHLPLEMLLGKKKSMLEIRILLQNVKAW